MASVYGVQPYTRSGAVDWGRYVPWALACFAVAGLMSVVLAMLGEWGWYYYVIIPVLTALPAAAMLHKAVLWGHCRSRSVALVTGMLAGGILYFGSFYTDMVRIGGAEIAPRVELLPGFIAARMETDQVKDLDRVIEANVGRNWLFFVLDGVGICLLVGLAAFEATGRAYCEECRRWLSQANAHLAAGLAQQVSEALVARRLSALAELPSYDSEPAEANTLLTIEYCPGRLQGTSRCAAYVSVAEQAPAGESNPRHKQRFLSQHPISNAELCTLAAKAPPLRRLTGDELAPAGADAPAESPDLEQPVPA